MASKIVTLKDHNNDIAYPITPVDAVFVDTNTTLSDELNDKADADMSNIDNASITSSKIDWTTIPQIIAMGTHSFTNIPAGAGSSHTCQIPVQPDTNYTVFVTHQASSQAYSWVMPTVNNKTTSSFILYVWNDNSGAANCTIDWMVVRNASS